MEFTSAEFTRFREDVNRALTEVGEKYDLQIKCGNIRYEDFSFSVKLECTKVDENQDVAKSMFERDYGLYGFQPEDYNIQFFDKGDSYRLVGFKPKARTNTCEILREKDGQIFVCPPEFIKARLIGQTDKKPNDFDRKEADPVKKQMFESLCRMFGFEKTDYNLQFTDRGTSYRLVGFNAKARKNTCKIIREKDGKEFVCEPEYVKQCLRQSA